MAKSKTPNTINIKLFNGSNVFDRWIVDYQILSIFKKEKFGIEFRYKNKHSNYFFDNKIIWTTDYNKGMIGQTKYKLNTITDWKLFLNDLNTLLTMNKLKHEDFN